MKTHIATSCIPMLFDRTPNQLARIRIGRTMLPPQANDFRCLDIGEPNCVGTALLSNADNTFQCDFDYEVIAPASQYDIILALDVIEHLMNPLLFMENVKKLLSKHGELYLSTSLAREWYPLYPHGNAHFTEYTRSKLYELFEKSGWKVTQERVFIPFRFRDVFKGFRPILRLLIQRSIMFRLVKV